MKKILLALLLLSLSNTAHCTNWCGDAQIGGCWTYEEGSGNPQDISSNNNDGVISGTVTWSTLASPAAYSSSYLVFDGSDDYVGVGTMGNFGGDIKTQDALSCTSWFLSSDTTNKMSIFGQVNITGGNIVNFGLNTNKYENFDAHNLFGHIRDTDSQARRASVNLASGVVDGNWHHYVMTVVPSTFTFVFYLDGVAQTTDLDAGTTPDNMANFDAQLTHGARNVRNTSYDFDFTGNLDEVAVFSKILDSTDVNDIMDNGLYQSTISITIIFPVIYD